LGLIDKRGLVAVLVASGLALGAGGAVAQGLPGAGSWYVKGLGGATFPQDDDFDLDEVSPCTFGSPCLSFDSGLSYDTGYVLGVAAGLEVTPSIAVELEYAYRNADARLKDVGDRAGSTESNAWMVNGLYSFAPLGPTGQWRPYTGGGLGAADLEVKEMSPSELDDFDSDYNFAYQLIGGIAYDVNPNLSLNGELRFFGINDQDIENEFFKLKTTYQTFDVLVGDTYHF
jgi:opacity protein-like surface antigen